MQGIRGELTEDLAEYIGLVLRNLIEKTFKWYLNTKEEPACKEQRTTAAKALR